VAQIQAIQSSATAEIQAIQTELLAKRAELRSLVWQKSPDQTVLKAKYEEIAALNQEIFNIAQEARQAFLAVLTPEQQAKYKETPGLGFGPCGRGGKLVSPSKNTNTNLTVKGL
jgi:Spy/CpxP family protein refolding chaperone